MRKEDTFAVSRVTDLVVFLCVFTLRRQTSVEFSRASSLTLWFSTRHSTASGKPLVRKVAQDRIRQSVQSAKRRLWFAPVLALARAALARTPSPPSLVSCAPASFVVVALFPLH